MNITLNGRDYPLRFSVNALCCLEEKTNLSLSGLQGRQMSCIRGLIWCGLLETPDRMTLEEAGALLDAHLRSGGSLEDAASALAAALEDACFFPKRAQATAAASPSAPGTAI